MVLVTDWNKKLALTIPAKMIMFTQVGSLNFNNGINSHHKPDKIIYDNEIKLVRKFSKLICKYAKGTEVNTI